MSRNATVFIVVLLTINCMSMLLTAEVASAGNIAFQSDRTGNFDIWMINDNGTGLRNITPLPGYNNTCPSYSPDGTELAYVRDATDIRIYNTKTGQDSLLYHSSVGNLGYGGGGHLAWSPDGSSIAFCEGDYQTTHLKTFNVANPYGTLVDHYNSAFSITTNDVSWVNVNGTDYLYYIGWPDQYNSYTTRMARLNLSTGENQWMTSADIGACSLNELAYSSVTNKIAFRTESGGLDTMNPDGSGLSQLALVDPAYFCTPEWSPDGQEILFCGRLPSDSYYYLYFLDPQSGALTKFDAANQLGSYNVYPTWTSVPEPATLLLLGLGGLTVLRTKK